MKPLGRGCLIVVLCFLAYGCQQQPENSGLSSGCARSMPSLDQISAELVELGMPRVSLVRAAETGDVTAVLAHICAGSDLNVGQNVGLSFQMPLHKAAENGHLLIALLLVSAGAEIDVENEYGKTPLAFAIGQGQDSVAKLLMNIS